MLKDIDLQVVISASRKNIGGNMYQDWIEKYDEYIEKENYCPMCRKKVG